jgi:hypothetical protein
LAGYWINRFEEYISSDNDLCIPFLNSAQLAFIWAEMDEIAEKIEGPGAKPAITLDLEHLQVADYRDFPPTTEQQKEEINKLLSAEPIRTDEMAYLALRSMIGLHWRKPESEQDIRRASAYDIALNITLKRISSRIAETLMQNDSKLPYWGRLGFLRVMVTIPDEQIEIHRLQRVACTLLKAPSFNARSFRYDEYDLIGMNFALEPILKGLNRMLLHFFHTEEMAGPRRLERAWASLVPVAAYFWGRVPVPVSQLSRIHILFDEEMMKYAHAITASQVDFIIRHELGHLIMDHGRRINSVTSTGNNKELRHEFEFAADVFAQGSMRSALYSRLRVALQWDKESSVSQDVGERGIAALHDHQREVSGVRLLFYYMDVIDKIGQLLKRRLGNNIQFRSAMDSHPSALERLARLDAMHVGEHAPTSQLMRYAEKFFSDALEYGEQLDLLKLSESLQEAYSV